MPKKSAVPVPLLRSKPTPRRTAAAANQGFLSLTREDEEYESDDGTQDVADMDREDSPLPKRQKAASSTPNPVSRLDSVLGHRPFSPQEIHTLHYLATQPDTKPMAEMIRDFNALHRPGRSEQVVRNKLAEIMASLTSDESAASSGDITLVSESAAKSIAAAQSLATSQKATSKTAKLYAAGAQVVGPPARPPSPQPVVIQNAALETFSPRLTVTPSVSSSYTVVGDDNDTPLFDSTGDAAALPTFVARVGAALQLGYIHDVTTKISMDYKVLPDGTSALRFVVKKTPSPLPIASVLASGAMDVLTRATSDIAASQPPPRALALMNEGLPTLSSIVKTTTSAVHLSRCEETSSEATLSHFTDFPNFPTSSLARTVYATRLEGLEAALAATCDRHTAATNVRAMAHTYADKIVSSFWIVPTISSSQRLGFGDD